MTAELVTALLFTAGSLFFVVGNFVWLGRIFGWWA